MNKRIPTWAGLLILLALIVAPTAAWGWAKWSRSAAEANSFAVLAAADTPEKLREAVGPLGIVFEFRDSSWIAIRYEDSHAAPGWSSAVARDSGGGWFASEVHFCGRFKTHRLRRSQGDAADPELMAIEQSESLDAARAVLVKIGFKPALDPKR